MRHAGTLTTTEVPVRRLTRLGSIAAIATTALLGAACEADDGGPSPGQEEPADDTNDDDGLY
jgi:hypothetical protein